MCAPTNIETQGTHRHISPGLTVCCVGALFVSVLNHSPTKTGVFLKRKNINRNLPFTVNELFSIDQLEALMRGLLRSCFVHGNTNLPWGYVNVLIRRGAIKGNNTMKNTQTLESLLNQCLYWVKCFCSFSDGAETV